jgi:2-polyprenyl-3-methyl-5-hydroxy-6-metoxy-1,4-benzoquinol methylase
MKKSEEEQQRQIRMSDHDQDLARAFDSQAPLFERAPVQSDPVAIDRLVAEADLPAGCLVLDAGCGPGLVSAALLEAGHRVIGVDLSREMIERAIKRCSIHGANARFFQTSVFDRAIDGLGPFDATLSRYVLHHLIDPAAFLARQVELLRPGGILIANDQVTDPDPLLANHHAAIEVARDQTHTRNLKGGQLVDLFAAAGLTSIRYIEDTFTLDFDEWFDRGTPGEPKETVREWLLSGPVIRSFRARLLEDRSIRIDGLRAIVRGVNPTNPQKS